MAPHKVDLYKKSCHNGLTKGFLAEILIEFVQISLGFFFGFCLSSDIHLKCAGKPLSWCIQRWVKRRNLTLWGRSRAFWSGRLKLWNGRWHLFLPAGSLPSLTLSAIRLLSLKTNLYLYWLVFTYWRYVYSISLVLIALMSRTPSSNSNISRQSTIDCSFLGVSGNVTRTQNTRLLLFFKNWLRIAQMVVETSFFKSGIFGSSHDFFWEKIFFSPHFA